MYLFFLYIKKKKYWNAIALNKKFLKKNFNLFTRMSFKFNLLEKML